MRLWPRLEILDRRSDLAQVRIATLRNWRTDRNEDQVRRINLRQGVRDCDPAPHLGVGCFQTRLFDRQLSRTEVSHALPRRLYHRNAEATDSRQADSGNEANVSRAHHRYVKHLAQSTRLRQGVDRHRPWPRLDTAQDKQDVGRALGQASHEVRVRATFRAQLEHMIGREARLHRCCSA